MTLPFDSSNRFQHKQLLVFMMITAVFCGCFNSFREIVKERSSGASGWSTADHPYVLSKLMLQSVFLVIGYFAAADRVGDRGHPGNFILHYMLLLRRWRAALGLVISALVNFRRRRSASIVVMIMQIIFGMTSPHSKALMCS